MAAVYLARARAMGGFERDVAVKMTHPHLGEDPELVTSLLQEARIAARIRHPNVVPVLDVGEHESSAYLVMDYVEGEVLSAIARRERTAKGKIPLPIALRILCDALAGLHAAHELRDDQGRLLEVVHRDFSPQNILVGLDGAARLTDFGIARVASLSSSTRSGFIKGKLGYLAPEQIRSPRTVDRRVDVWAAGVVAWELVTGQLLHPREEEAAMLLRIVSEEPGRARAASPEVPPALDDAIADALKMDPAQRIGSAEELRRRILEAGSPIADPSEVAVYVASHAGTKLRDRKQQADAVLARSAQPVESLDVEVEPRTATELTTTPTRPPKRGRRWIAAVVGVPVGIAAVGAAAMLSARVGRPAAPLPVAHAAPTNAPPVDPLPAATTPVPASASAAPAVTMEAGVASSASRLSPIVRRISPAPARSSPPAAKPPAGRPGLPTDSLDDGH
jgi:serine/threonine-protein kinase